MAVQSNNLPLELKCPLCPTLFQEAVMIPCFCDKCALTNNGHRNFSEFGGQKKARTCYTCGSPDHLMRDCPASHPNPMFQPGNGAFHGGMPEYAQPYWNSSSMPPFSLYGNMYGNPAAAMMSYYAQFQVSPYCVSPYMSSMYGGMPPGPCGNMRPHQSEYFGLQHPESNRSIEDFPR